MKRLFTVVICFCVVAVHAQNINLSNYSFSDTEPYIAVNPTDSNNIIAAWMKATGFAQLSIAISYSTDGGQNWTMVATAPHQHPAYTSADVSIAFNTSGKAFLTYVDYALNMDSGCVLIINSVNDGATWSSAAVVIDGLETPDKPVDRPWVAVDQSGGAYDGRIYVTSKNYSDGVTTNHVYMKYSSNDGATWSALDILDDSIPCDLLSSMGALAVAADGTVDVVYDTWHLSQSLAARVVIVRSSDGGATFSTHVISTVPANTAINDTLQGSTTLSANPTNAQNLVLTYTSNMNGDADIVSIHSSDGGTTWNAATPVRVNDDAMSNGNQQDMSWAGFAPNGTYVVTWRDRRNSGTQVTSPFEIWMAASVNGGVSFAANHMISSVLSPDIPMQRGNDFIGIAASSSFVHNDWCDARTGNNEIFYNRDSLSQLVTVHEALNIMPSITWYVSENEIYFHYNLGADLTASHVEIVDMNGRVVRTLFEGTQSRGEHDVVLASEKLATGTYIFRVVSPTWTSQVSFIRN